MIEPSSETISVAQYAEALARLLHYRLEPSGRVLASLGISDEQWRRDSVQWAERLALCECRMQSGLALEFTAALAKEQRRLERKGADLPAAVAPKAASYAPAVVAPQPMPSDAMLRTRVPSSAGVASPWVRPPVEPPTPPVSARPLPPPTPPPSHRHSGAPHPHSHAVAMHASAPSPPTPVPAGSLPAPPPSPHPAPAAEMTLDGTAAIGAFVPRDILPFFGKKADVAPPPSGSASGHGTGWSEAPSAIRPAIPQSSDSGDTLGAGTLRGRDLPFNRPR